MTESSYVGLVQDPTLKGKRVGFTGSRYGMTEQQLNAFRKLIRELQPTEFHHGDAVGADEDAANAVNQLLQRPQVVSHPCWLNSWRAFTKFNDAVRKVKEPHFRNRDIVTESDVLIACPKQMKRGQSGGTWYTLGHCERQGKPRFVIWPDGAITAPHEEIP